MIKQALHSLLFENPIWLCGLTLLTLIGHPLYGASMMKECEKKLKHQIYQKKDAVGIQDNNEKKTYLKFETITSILRETGNIDFISKRAQLEMDRIRTSLQQLGGMQVQTFSPEAVGAIENVNTIILDIVNNATLAMAPPEKLRVRYYQGHELSASAKPTLKEVNITLDWLSLGGNLSTNSRAILAHEIGHVVFFDMMTALTESLDLSRHWPKPVENLKENEFLKQRDQLSLLIWSALNERRRGISPINDSQLNQFLRDWNFQIHKLDSLIDTTTSQIAEDPAVINYKKSRPYQEVFSDFLAVIDSGDPAIFEKILPKSHINQIRNFTFSGFDELMKIPYFKTDIENTEHLELYRARYDIWNHYYIEPNKKPKSDRHYDSLVMRVVFESMADIILGIDSFKRRVEKGSNDNLTNFPFSPPHAGDGVNSNLDPKPKYGA